MKHQTVDRRIQRTQSLSQEALVSLLAEKPYHSITVQDIIDRANIGRSTFYAHYRDKEDLLASGTNDIVHSIILDAEGSTNDATLQLISIAPLFQHIQKQFKLHRALLGSGGIESVVSQIRKHIEGHVLERLVQDEDSPSNQPIPDELTAFHIASTVLHLVRWWLDNNRPASPEEMDTYFQYLINPAST